MVARVAHLAAIALVATGHALRAQCPDGAPPPCAARGLSKPALVISAFRNLSSDTADAYLAAWITEELTAQLRSASGVRVLSAGGAGDYVMHGTVRRDGPTLYVTARLEQPSGRVAWNTPLRVLARNVTLVPDSIVSGVAKALGISRPPSRSRRAANPEVADLYARGVYQMNRRSEPSLQRAVALFRQAIARDSTSALGWSGLARAMERASVWRFAISGVPHDSLLSFGRAAADRATELEPDNPDVWLMRGRVSVDVDQTTRAAALRAYRRAIALDSANGEAWRALGLTLMEVDDTSAARAAFERAVAVNPNDGENIGWVAWYLVWRREFDTASRWADSAVSVDPTHTLVRNAAGVAAYFRDALDESEGHYDVSRRLSTGPQIEGHTGLARIALRRGNAGRARELLREALARSDSTRPNVHTPYLLAEVYLLLGDTATALQWLERFEPRRDMHYQMHLRYEPGLDGIRKDPRFRALLARP